jgi:hypothetical protein
MGAYWGISDTKLRYELQLLNPRLLSFNSIQRNMALGDSILAVSAFTLAEAYFLQRTIFTDTTFQRICLSALGVNILLKVFYNIIIWPFLLSPTRHLPKVKVGNKAK